MEPLITSGLRQIEELYGKLESQISTKELVALINDVKKAIKAGEEANENVFIKAISEIGRPAYLVDMYDWVVSRYAKGFDIDILEMLKNYVRQVEYSTQLMRRRGKHAAAGEAVERAVQDSVKILNMCLKLVEAKEENDTALAAAAEAPADATLGQIAFATKRKDKPFELDTAEETRLYTALRRYFDENTPLDAKDVGTIKELLANGWYADVFAEPTANEVYRGMSVSEEWLQKITGQETLPEVGEADINVSFKPKNNSSSWSTDSSMAEYFSIHPAQRGKGFKRAVVLHANVADNPGNFVSATGLYGVEGLDEFTGENEVIGLGPIKIHKISWETWDMK